jgi:CheY-like chemotaxis protein
MSITITVRLRMIERDGACAMAHVLVFYDEPSIAGLLALACEEEGHVVTTVHMVDDALMVLRSSLHPLVALCDHDLIFRHPSESFFAIIRDHPELYGQHRYIAFTSWSLSDDEQVLLDEVGVPLVSAPFSLMEVVDLIAATGLT